MSLRFGLVTMNPFPKGNVATVRYSTYCKELVKNGVFVKVYIIAPSRTAASNFSIQGMESGVEYQYMCNKTGFDGKPSLWKKFFYYTFGLFRTLVQLRKDQVDCVLLYANDCYSYFTLWLFKACFGVRLISDKSEYPYGYKKKGKLGRIIADIKLKVFDGFIVMTDELRVFYSRKKSMCADIFLLPMTVDADKFVNANRLECVEPYIACVFGTHNRDGLLDTIMAYAIYLNRMQIEAFKLVLIGDIDNLQDNGATRVCINKNGLNEHVCFKGAISPDLIPDLLMNSRALITTARSYASGGFPTKLGEYFAAGRPVVATTAGEISHYVENRVHAYLAKPGDVDEIAECLIEIQRDQEMAEKIAKAGQCLTRDIFNAATYVDRLINFLQRS